MRTVIYNFIKALGLKNYKLTDNLPWEDNGAPLYHHNKKHIYVNTSQTIQNPMIDAFNHQGTVDEITTISVFFVNDAKTLPSDYDAVCNQIKEARLAPGTEGYIQRTCNVSSSFIADSLVTEFAYSFRKLLTN